MTALRPERQDGATPPWQPDEYERRAAAVGDSSDTLALRLPPSGRYPGARGTPEGMTEGPAEGVEGGEAAEAGGRAARRRAEQQSRRRGGRRPPPPKVKESPGIVVVRTLGELFITLGVLMFLFVAYQLWWTNVTADAYASGAKHKLESQWAPGGTDKSHPAYPAAIAVGTKFAIIYIPKLDVETPIAEGVDKTTILDNGLVGHYTGAQETAFPWDSTGNFALAGHRNTHGEPFRYINKLVPGDQVIVETAYDYYVYTVTSTLAQTSPTNVSVIEPVPPQSGFTGPGRYITLTTCTPEFTSTYRMAVWGKLTQDLPKSSGQTPKALQSG
ncbi:class E sortase [Streptacidiphilus sp. P02-A3a]|uniref:class E sortase n=1 Tax=Streptacidiphilus sp. P02-A3a TaxID=2704468 RepID=UPI0015F893F3|nr:class E sortase [Streptacidiphilus sp. P02-A3a]QMU66854.1 class E sortase [Streptacidiphilus sp. P02-A3a]